MIWDLASGSPLRELVPPRRRIRVKEVAASPCGSKLAISSHTDNFSVRHLCLWDVAMGSLQERSLPEQPRSDYNNQDQGAVVFSHGGDRMLFWRD